MRQVCVVRPNDISVDRSGSVAEEFFSSFEQPRNNSSGCVSLFGVNLFSVVITHSHGSASVLEATKQVNGKGQNLTPRHAKNHLTNLDKNWRE